MSAAPKRNAMVIDLRRCVGCHACTVACKMENNVPVGAFRSWVQENDKGSVPEVTRVKLPRLCNQCDNAPCEQVCPVNASQKGEGGAVLINKERCTGCRYCLAACPHDARYIDPREGTADKCTFCAHRTDAGLLPACVSTCIAHARYFGDLNDPNSEVSRLMRTHSVQPLRPELGTAPSVFYIGLDESMEGIGPGQKAGRR